MSFLTRRDQFGGSRITQNASGDTDGDGVLGEVRHYKRVGADDSARPNADTAGDDRARPNKDAVPKDWSVSYGRPNRDAVS